MVKWELEGVPFKGDNITLEAGTKAQCKKAFEKMTEAEKEQFYFIALQPYNNDFSERLDDDEILYSGIPNF